MIIKSITISELLNNKGDISYNFNRDLNIFTGRNGSGKTTIMKLIWFIISGNINYALREVEFKYCILKTSLYTCKISKINQNRSKITVEHDGGVENFEDDIDIIEDLDVDPFSDYAWEKANPFFVDIGASIFFPTFRRIEGGFSLATRPSNVRSNVRPKSDIDDALSSLSKKMTNADHLFVSAISTQDINELLLRRYASFSEEINLFQQDVSRNVIDKIRHYEQSQNSRESADDLLSETRKEIEKIDEFWSKTLKPLDLVRNLVEKLFQHSGISFGRRLNFGDAAAAVNSDLLSAGEKQMLSFICYNAFYKNSIIFIDEPELSLHVDWQRQLSNILQSQNSSNQFIFATHSPFIYGKYPDKELSISVDRGE